MTVDFDPIAIALQVAREFDALGIAYTIGGSIAGSFAGEPRSTLDIDIVAAVLETHVPLIIAALEHDFYVDRAALQRAVRERQPHSSTEPAESGRVRRRRHAAR